MPTSDEIVKEIQKAQAELAATKAEHDQIRSDIILGPMDDVSPWTETGTRMQILRERIERKTFELGREVLRERAG